MVTRNSILAGALAATFLGFSLPSFADDLYISVDPPARRIEKYDNRPGQVYVPGNWEYRNNKHEWVDGRYVAERKGYHYQPDRWVQHDNQKWTNQRGGWARDEDAAARSPG